MSNLLEIYDDDAFASELDLDPMKALKRCQDDYERNDLGHRDNRYKLIERATLVHHKLEKSHSLRKRFRADELWVDRKYDMRGDQLLLHCMQYLLKAPTSRSPKYNTACDYADAAEVLLKEGIKSRSIFAALKARGGPYKILREKRATDNPSAKKVEQENLREDGSDSGEREISKGENAGGEKPEGSALDSSSEDTKTQTSAGDISGDRSPPKRSDVFQAKRDIAVRGNEYQERMLSIESHHRRWVLLRWLEDEGNVRCIEVIDMKEECEIRVRSQ